MCLLRRKPSFSIFHYPCTWSNSPWVTECEASTLDWVANMKCSNILSWERSTQLWWSWLGIAPVSEAFSFPPPFFYLLFSTLSWLILAEEPGIAKIRVRRGKEMNVVFLKLTEVGSSEFMLVSQRVPNSYTFWNLILHLAFYEDEILGRWLFCFLTSYQTVKAPVCLLRASCCGVKIRKKKRKKEKFPHEKPRPSEIS